MHLSMRVPWHDQGWNGHVCADPLGNSSCTLLQNIGAKRNDAYEVEHAGEDMTTLDPQKLPCLSERATFMSPTGYTVRKRHPYAFNDALKALQPTDVVVGPYSFEGVPFRWVNRRALEDEIGHHRVPGFAPHAEEAAARALGSPDWISHGDNQRAVFDAFYEPIVPGDSLVLIYMKHSPFQEGERVGRLLVGAARVTSLKKPPLYDRSGSTAFPSLMWETIVSHSLRPDMQDGILLPYQQLLPLLDAGTDISEALAWAPPGREIEFSYVTEHVSDDAAIQALEALKAAAVAFPRLGLSDLSAGSEWVEAQLARLWKARGPVPGLASVLGALTIEHPYTVARAFLAAVPDGADPWGLLEAGLADPQRLPEAVRPKFTGSFRKMWATLDQTKKRALKILSSFDISLGHVRLLLEGKTEVPLSLDDFVDTPYWISACTYGQEYHVPFTTVDRAFFPPELVAWQSPAARITEINEPDDRVRIEAMLTEVLEQAALEGDTLLPLIECLERANNLPIARRPILTEDLLRGLELHPDDLPAQDSWPVVGASVAPGGPALKLHRHQAVGDRIRGCIDRQRSLPGLGGLSDPRKVIDDAIGTLFADDDMVEEAARSEKAAGLTELHGSALSVLVGAAGTGKTTLLKALVSQVPGSVTLLAPTGKARVQLQSKVGHRAETLASFLFRTGRFDGARYRTVGPAKRVATGLLVIDEASMLTEEMFDATLDAFSAIKRLVLVGDPHQLPPIGAGRPFVDLVNVLRPSSGSSTAGTASGYVELSIPRRQAPTGSSSVRWDLELAAYFADMDRSPSSEEVWERLRAGEDLQTVRYEQWAGRAPATALRDVLTAELNLPADEQGAVAEFARSYGATVAHPWINWDLGAGRHAEDWQVLAPTRARAFGSTEINRSIKRAFRTADLEGAIGTRRIVPKPIGPEQIVLGDKVMQTVNSKRKAYPDGSGLGYVANGEIGVAVGRRGTFNKNRPLTVEFASQHGAQYSYWPSGSEDQPIELAWAVTVHKAQGSEFSLTILMIPAHVSVSRELMYTALTRQEDRVVILHDGEIDELWDLTPGWRSETARRVTDLFQKPDIEVREVAGTMRRFDRNLIHVTSNGTFVRSKNEVIVAEILEDLVPGSWRYEEPLQGADGATRYPDFTITRGDSTKVYWEHLGMLDNPKYAVGWATKEAWYQANGIRSAAVGGGTRGTLITTSDIPGVNVAEWRKLALDVLGETAARPAASGPKKKRRRAGLNQPVADS